MNTGLSGIDLARQALAAAREAAQEERRHPGRETAAAHRHNRAPWRP
ncbi:hypothetical protein [Streptomyces achromogenes]